jgi:carboxymethylenebutenolidase
MPRLRAADGHELEVYVAEPDGPARAGLVVVQEIFGITEHIKRVADGYAAEGFRAIAPAMFDRIEPGIVLDYTDVPAGRAYMQRLKWPDTLADIDAAVAAVRGHGRVGVVGFCWGGSVAHAAAARLDIDAAVAYYGGQIARMLDQQPRCPIMYHFGEQDHAIPMSDVRQIGETVRGAIVHVYPGAGHGFSCEDRQSFEPAAAKLARQRSVEFLRSHLLQ